MVKIKVTMILGLVVSRSRKDLKETVGEGVKYSEIIFFSESWGKEELSYIPIENSEMLPEETWEKK